MTVRTDTNVVRCVAMKMVTATAGTAIIITAAITKTVITVITITMAAIVMSGTITTAITITATITTAIIITAITIIMAIITIAAIIIMAVTVTITAVITIIAIIMATNEKMIPIAIEEMIHTVREHIIRMKELITPRDRSSMNVCHSRTIITIIVHRSIMMEAMG